MSENTTEIKEAIAESAVEGIRSVTTDGTTVVGESLSERIGALHELQKQEAAASPCLPIRFSKVISQGL